MSCNNPINNGKFMNSADCSLKELEQLVIEKGDTSAYQEMSIQYLDLRKQEFLFYALVMANKYDYPQAFFDVFDCLTYLDNYDLMDEKTAALAIKYLILAANMGHEQAQEMISEYDIIESDTNYVAQIKRLYE